MFHKNVANSLRSVFPEQIPELTQPRSQQEPQTPSLPVRLALVPPGRRVISQEANSAKSSSSHYDLVAIAAHRCSSFFAEAAVLVLVLALLDRFMLKGRMEINWVLSAFTISLLLLATSIATEFTARRWLKAH